MKTEKIKLSQLKPAEYNPRSISDEELNKLSSNLEEFGLVDPIIIDLKDNNTIVGGHQRYKALIKKHNLSDELFLLKLGDIGWVFESDNLKIKDKKHQKALNVSLNKIQGEWDYGKLTAVFNDLDKSNFDLSLTGFDDLEIQAFNIEDNIFFNEDIYINENELEKIYTPPQKDNDSANSGETINEEVVDYEENTNESIIEEEPSLEYNVFSLEIVFKTEEEMDEAFKKLSDEGYNVRR